ncbi:hypothetical protein PNEG_01968 [Pneumocystis murina B123]|uniref:Aminotransferase class I/classII large domain-containing protein n=1 Tax=Pneumocystis murina (strain B123) TaxID=1069680 RepID=M7P7G5_PNEMU|nr:hypothetical protein PNEG_01968 [Pneumocystis murina B123]EMR09785.1 hypothetical protein PNEG_01968 [Pneumocystis murina B123]
MENSLFEDVPYIEKDVIFELMRLYKDDKFEKKVDLGIGVYRDNYGKPCLLSSVRKAESIIITDPNYNHEYLPIDGLPSFIEASKKLVFGENSPLINSGCVSSVQTISGTGANHLGSLFISLFNKGAVCYFSRPTWSNHDPIWKHAGLTIREYPYFDESTCGFDFEGMITTLQEAPENSIILLHVCGHNPTGVDPTREQWIKICDVMKEKKLFPFFDFAYQGFVSGDIDEDAWPIRHFSERGFELCVCHSFSKSFGLYGERCGCFHLVVKSPDIAKNVHSQLVRIQRNEISSPPSYGAKIVSLILNNEQLTQEWKKNILEISNRIKEIRKLFYQELIRLGTPGSWEHIINQVGMFSYLSLSEKDICRLVNEFHIYIPSNGRISISGLRTGNLEYVARAFDTVVRDL